MPFESPFTPATFRFLRDLRKNNDRDWLEENRDRYERDVRDPALRFVTGFAAPLRRISPHLVADARPTGGSLFRIHRDVRFSADKRPYKTHLGVQFRHEAGRDAHAPGLYLHLEPGNAFAAAGVWRPARAALAEIRDALDEDPATWRRVTTSRRFRNHWALDGESLKRVPRGYDPEHELSEDLKRKEFVAVTGLREREVCAPEFPERLQRAWQTAVPFLRFLTSAQGLPW